MASMLSLAGFSTWVLLSPPLTVALVLDLMAVPFSARVTFLAAVLINIGFSFAFERWLTSRVARVVGLVTRGIRRSSRRRDGKVYKALEDG